MDGVNYFFSSDDVKKFELERDNNGSIIEPFTNKLRNNMLLVTGISGDSNVFLNYVLSFEKEKPKFVSFYDAILKIGDSVFGEKKLLSETYSNNTVINSTNFDVDGDILIGELTGEFAKYVEESLSLIEPGQRKYVNYRNPFTVLTRMFKENPLELLAKSPEMVKEQRTNQHSISKALIENNQFYNF